MVTRRDEMMMVAAVVVAARSLQLLSLGLPAEHGSHGLQTLPTASHSPLIPSYASFHDLISAETERIVRKQVLCHLDWALKQRWHFQRLIHGVAWYLYPMELRELGLLPEELSQQRRRRRNCLSAGPLRFDRSSPRPPAEAPCIE